MWIPEDVIDDIRQRVNIVDIISKYVQLTERGQNHFGHCPFHEDQTPSFSVQEEKQFYHCFSCGRGGNVFSFIMEIEGLTFPEAVVKVAELADIPLADSISQQAQQSENKVESEQDVLLKLHEGACDFYQQVLTQTAVGKEALDYFHKRGLEDETIEFFQLGYSPAQKGALLDYIQGKYQIDSHFFDQSSLFYQSKDGDYLDRFSQRLIFPITNARDQVVAFSGRYLDVGQKFESDHPPAKYVNSTDTPIFNKSQLLFNFAKARPDIRRQNEVILFEGYMDVIASWQAGVKNGVASMGTSLTDPQLQLIERVCDRVVIAYDGDEAGQEAIHRAIELLQGRLLEIEIVMFDKGMDPDDFIREEGAEAFRHLIQHSRLTVMGFYLQYYRLNRHLENESERIDYIQDVLSRLVDIPQALERELILKSLAEEFDIDLSVLKEEFQQALVQKQHQQIVDKHQTLHQTQSDENKVKINYQAQAHPCETAENIILHRLFQHPVAVYPLLSQAENFQFQTDSAQILALVFEEFYHSQQEELDLSKFIDYLKEKALKERVVQVESMVMNDAFSEEEVLDSIHYLEAYKLKQEIKKTKQLLSQAAERADVDQQNKYLQLLLALTQQLESYQ